MRQIKAWYIARKPCYVCGYKVGSTNRVNTNDNWYHFDCWVKASRHKVFGEKADEIQ